MTAEPGISLEEQRKWLKVILDQLPAVTVCYFGFKHMGSEMGDAILVSLKTLQRAQAIAREQRTELLKGRTVSTYERVAALKYLIDALLKEQP